MGKIIGLILIFWISAALVASFLDVLSQIRKKTIKISACSFGGIIQQALMMLLCGPLFFSKKIRQKTCPNCF